MSISRALSRHRRGHGIVPKARFSAGVTHLALIVTVLCVVAAGFLIGEWWLWAPQPPTISGQGKSGAQEPQGDHPGGSDGFRLRSLDTFSGVWERPLFIQGRRPPPPPPPEPEITQPVVPEPPPPPKEPLKMEISAILAIGQERSIMLRNPPKDAPSRLKLGSEYQGWVVERIGDDMVVMSRGDEHEEVALRKFDAAPPGPEAAAAAPGAAAPGAPAGAAPVQELKQQIEQAKRQSERPPRQRPEAQAPPPPRPQGLGGAQTGRPSLPAGRVPRQPKAGGAKQEKGKGNAPPGI